MGLRKRQGHEGRRIVWPWSDRGRSGYAAADVMRELERLRAWIDVRLIADGLVRL